MLRVSRASGLAGRLITALIALAAAAVAVIVLSAVHLLPQLRNPFAETTTDRSGPALLKSITPLSRYEAASGSFQVVVDLTKHASFIPSCPMNSVSLPSRKDSDIAFVDFSRLKSPAIR